MPPHSKEKGFTPEDDQGEGMSEIAGWQPIETAPRDGSMFLAYNAAVGVYSTSYTKWWRKQDGTANMDYRGFPCGQWGGALGQWDCQPTHWMPLPMPPSTLTDEAKLRRSKALDELGALDGEMV